MTQISKVQDLLERSVQKVSQLQCALVVSVDGLLLCHSPASPRESGEVDKRAAMASALANLAVRIAEEEGMGAIDHAFVQAEGGLCMFGMTGSSVIGLYCDSEAELGAVGYELAVLMEQLPSLLVGETPRFVLSGAS
ncbi:roadblock/LC7 domain-containing protein [Streptomyces klenkii]|uniref:roadblock/LC7 domain-containing protein n=1 Tax=Streptomyces klenkii TaxID=1420899 RepID=UPI00341BA8EE